MRLSRKSLYGGALLVVVLGLCAWLGAYYAWRPKPAPVARRVQPVAPRSSVADALAQYRGAFHFPPDRRFLEALGAIERIAPHGPPKQAEAHHSEAGWSISVAGEVVGPVGELPTFDELFAVLVEHARKSLSQGAPIGPRPEPPPQWPADEFFPRSAFAALDRLGASWSHAPDGATAERAAVLLTGLLEQVHSDLDFDTPLAARALAAIAVARALDPSAAKTEECLTAYLLGYSSHAQQLAELGGVDPAVAAYVLRANARLAEAAQRPGSDLRARYLHLVRLAQRDDVRPWHDAVVAWHPGVQDAAAVLGSGLGQISFETQDVPPYVLLNATFSWLHEAPPQHDDGSWVLRRSGDVLSAVRTDAAHHVGAFLDPEVAFAVDGSLQLWALRQWMNFEHNQRGSIRDCRWILEALPQTQIASLAELRRWFAIAVDWSDHQDTFARRHAFVVDGSSPIGSRSRGLFMGDDGWVVSLHDSAESARKQVFEFLSTLDSRPSHRAIAAPFVRNRLLDSARGDWLETSVARDNASGAPEAAVAVAGRHGGAAAVGAAISSERADALGWGLDWLTRKRAISQPETAATFAELWRRPELRHSVYWTYSKYLRERDDYPQIERISRQFLADPSSQHGIDHDLVTAELSSSVRLQGRHTEAWTLIEPILAGEAGRAYYQGVLALIDLKRYTKAEALARRGLERYPRDTLLELAIARARWRAGHSEDAVRAIVPPAISLHDGDFAELVPEAIRDSFPGQSKEPLEAFDALVRADVPNDPRARAGAIAAYFQAHDRPDLAFEMYARLACLNFSGLQKDPNAPLYDPPQATLARDKWRAEFLGLAWHALRSQKGEAEATRWVQSLGKAYPWDAAPHFFTAKAYELLWGAYVGDPGEYVWLLRADAILRDPEIAKRHGDEVRSHFEKPGNPTSAYYARVMLGFEPTADVLTRRVANTELCQVAYALGVAAEARGDLAQASDFYEVSISSNEITYNAYGYARQRLDEWRLADLPFEKSWTPPPTPGPVASLP